MFLSCVCGREDCGRDLCCLGPWFMLRCQDHHFLTTCSNVHTVKRQTASWYYYKDSFDFVNFLKKPWKHVELCIPGFENCCLKQQQENCSVFRSTLKSRQAELRTPMFLRTIINGPSQHIFFNVHHPAIFFFS